MKTIILQLITGLLVFFVFAPPGYGADRGDIRSGETRTNISLSGPSYLDRWNFVGAKGDRVIITAVTTSGSLDTEIRLNPPAGGPSEAFSGAGVDRLEWQLQTNGFYTIVVEDSAFSRAGSYNINFLKLPGSISSTNDPDGGPIASGQTLNGRLDVASDLDVFHFSGNRGDRVIITAVETSGNLDTEIRLYPPDGGTREAFSGAGVDRLDWQLQTNGLYTIIVEDSAFNRTGSYNINFLKLPGSISSTNDPVGAPIVSGQTLNGRLDVASDLDVFHFSGNRGDRSSSRPLKPAGTWTPKFAFMLRTVDPGKRFLVRVSTGSTGNFRPTAFTPLSLKIHFSAGPGATTLTS